MAISGTLYGLIWYSTSILGSWNSHWSKGYQRINGLGLDGVSSTGLRLPVPASEEVGTAMEKVPSSTIGIADGQKLQESGYDSTKSPFFHEISLSPAHISFMMKKWWRIPKKSQRRAFTRAPLASASSSCRSWIWTWGTRQILGKWTAKWWTHVFWDRLPSSKLT